MRTVDESTMAADAVAPRRDDDDDVVFVSVVVQCDVSYDATSTPYLAIVLRNANADDGLISYNARTIDPYAIFDGDIEYRTTS